MEPGTGRGQRRHPYSRSSLRCTPAARIPPAPGHSQTACSHRTATGPQTRHSSWPYNLRWDLRSNLLGQGWSILPPQTSCIALKFNFRANFTLEKGRWRTLLKSSHTGVQKQAVCNKAVSCLVLHDMDVNTRVHQMLASHFNELFLLIRCCLYGSVLDISYKWNHTTCDLLCLASFI